MDIKKLDENTSVAGQISVEDVHTIKEKGFKIIVCNRPDGEAPDQADSREIPTG